MCWTMYIIKLDKSCNATEKSHTVISFALSPQK